MRSLLTARPYAVEQFSQSGLLLLDVFITPLSFRGLFLLDLD